MKQTRIPYSLPMARARRAGLKTQTRRAMRPQPSQHHWEALPGYQLKVNSPYVGISGCLNVIFNHTIPQNPQWDKAGHAVCPYGQPGDILLPIEPWRAPAEFDGLPPIQIPAGTPIWLDANGPAPEGFGRYRHARFMPRHLIQARDELVAVRVERLQDIRAADVMAEGTPDRKEEFQFGGHELYSTFIYRRLWEQINGPGSWGANPWIWVIEFKVIAP